MVRDVVLCSSVCGSRGFPFVITVINLLGFMQYKVVLEPPREYQLPKHNSPARSKDPRSFTCVGDTRNEMSRVIQATSSTTELRRLLDAQGIRKL
jgi:hypothetical protein